MDFRIAHDVALDLDSRTPAELAELVDTAVARIVDAALELEPASDRAELGAAARAWVLGLDRPSLARLCGVVASASPRYDLRPVAGVIVTIVQAGAARRGQVLAGDDELAGDDARHSSSSR